MTDDLDLHPRPDDGGDALADERLARLLRAQAPEPPAAPFDTMWTAIELRAFGERAAAPAPSRPPAGLPAGRAWTRRWLGPAAGLAAGLLVGVGLGATLVQRGALPGGGAPAAVAASDVPRSSSAFVPETPVYRGVAPEYFDETVALLANLPARLDAGAPDARLVAQAGELLSTTRLLLDASAAADPEAQALLDDLELVLAQVVRLPAVREPGQAELITEALESRRVLPRLRSAALQASAAPVSRGD